MPAENDHGDDEYRRYWPRGIELIRGGEISMRGEDEGSGHATKWAIYASAPFQ